jgi:hypothetical protein
MSGEWNINKIARGMTAKQFIEWGLYAQMDPFGDVRGDIQAASIVQMVFNMAVSAKDRKPLKDFLLKFGDAVEEKKPSQPWQEKKAIAMTIAMAYAKSRAGKSKSGPVKQTSEEAARAMADNVFAMVKPKES